MEEVKKLAEECFMILKYFDKHKSILNKSKKSIYSNTNDLIKILNLKFSENFQKTIESFYSNIPLMNFEIYMKDILKYLELCKPFSNLGEGKNFSIFSGNLTDGHNLGDDNHMNRKMKMKKLSSDSISNNILPAPSQSSNFFTHKENFQNFQNKNFQNTGNTLNSSNNLNMSINLGNIGNNLSSKYFKKDSDFESFHKAKTGVVYSENVGKKSKNFISNLNEEKNLRKSQNLRNSENFQNLRNSQNLSNSPTFRCIKEYSYKEDKNSKNYQNLNQTADGINKVKTFNVFKYLNPGKSKSSNYLDSNEEINNQSVNEEFNYIKEEELKDLENFNDYVNLISNGDDTNTMDENKEKILTNKFQINIPKSMHMEINKSENYFDTENEVPEAINNSNKIQNTTNTTNNTNIVNFNYNFNITELIDENSSQGKEKKNEKDNSNPTANKKQKIVVRNDKIEIINVNNKSLLNKMNELNDKNIETEINLKVNKRLSQEMPTANYKNILKENEEFMMEQMENRNENNERNSKQNEIQNKDRQKKNLNQEDEEHIEELNHKEEDELNEEQNFQNFNKNSKNNNNLTLINTNTDKEIIFSTKPTKPDTPKSHQDLINLILTNFNKTKEIVSKILNYTTQVEFVTETIKNQISTNYNLLNENIIRSMNSLCDNISTENSLHRGNKKFLINFIENTKKIWLFDVKKMKCEIREFPNLTFKLTLASSVEFDDNDLIFITGGRLSGSIFESEPNFSNTFLILRWSNKSIEFNNQMPRKRGFHSSIYFDNKLYVIGGASNFLNSSVNNLKDSECYNIIDKRWELMPSMNYGRCNPSLCVYNGVYLYAFRGWGYSKEDSTHLDTIEFLNVKQLSNGWVLIKPEDPGMTWLPGSNSVATVLTSNQILICGGSSSYLNQNSSGNKFNNYTFIYDPVRKSVYRSKDMVKSAAFNTNGTVYENSVILIDWKNETGKPFGVHVYDVENKIWKFNQS
jgi:hypothetical protein